MRAKRRQFWLLLALGMIGLVSIAIAAAPVAQQQAEAIPDFPRLPLAVFGLLAVIQPTILLVLAVWIGVTLAPRLGLRSHIAEWASGRTPVWAPLRKELPLAVAIGMATGLVVAALDALVQPAMMSALKQGGVRPGGIVVETVSGILYGGITEELMTRWGLMSLITWVGGRVFQRDALPPRDVVFWAALTITAAVFGAGHLRAMKTAANLTPIVVVRTIGLNALAAIAYGWLYWRRSLESAMIAHASTHVVFAVAQALGA
ncbi:MAG TPA: CPBP family glutamic-type intramembrane protease [Gemmatimonadaceae bacterium]